MKKIISSLMLFLLCFNVNALEQEKEKGLMEKALRILTEPMENVIGPVIELQKIIITPSRIPEKIGASSSSVTVQGDNDFDKKKVYTIKEAMRDEVGIDTVQQAPFGGATSIFTRGANSNHTLVMIDGIRLYDTMSPSGAFNFAHLTTDNVESVEIVRGAQSALYGSDAIGGMINITTKKAMEPFFHANFESGSFYTYREQLGMGSYDKDFHYSFGFSRLDTKGISKAEQKNNNPENDPYSQMCFSLRADYDLLDNLTTGLTVRHTRNVNEIDFIPTDDPNYYEKNFESIYTYYLEHDVLKWWDYTLRCAWMQTERKYFDDNDGAESASVDYYRALYTGYLFKFDYQNNFKFFDIDTLTIGYEYAKEIGDSYSDYIGSITDMPKVFSDNSALYLSNRLNYQDRLTLTGALRVDNHSNAGMHTVYKVDGSYLLPTATKLRGGWATGFKAPTLYQLHATSFPGFNFFGTTYYRFDGGNANLQPEKSINWEMGMDQYLYDDKISLSATYFYNVYRDLIDTIVLDPTTYHISSYINIGKAFSRGVELSLNIKPIDILKISANYTHLRTKDTETDQELLRRARNKFNFSLDWTVFPKFNVLAKLNYVGPRFDINSDKLKEYYRVDVITSYKITENAEIYAKIENLFDYKYQEVRNYGTAGFSFYGGVNIKF